MSRKSSSAPAVPEIKIPSQGELQSQAVDANVRDIPRILEAYQKYGPQYGQALASVFRQTNPDFYGGFDPLQRLVNERLGYAQQAGLGGVPIPLLQNFTEGLRGAQAARGIAESPLSAASEASQLAEFGEGYKRNSISDALSLLGQTPQLGPVDFSSFGLNLPSIGESSRLGFDQSGLQAQATLGSAMLAQQRYAQEQQARMARNQSIGQGFGTILGAGAGFALGGPAGAYLGSRIGSQAGGGLGTYF